ncbi:MAG: ABC transporter substrate-binding protein [Deltaproteobacteria bacterium]|nr:ABC transporter substrate-binding protein [Deltaproteobacteria bacterium]
MNSRWLFMLLALVLLPQAVRAIVVSNEYRRVLPYRPSYFDPIEAEDLPEIQIIRQVFDSLVTIDKELAIIPLLAQKWDVDPSGLKYTFHLRNGTKFHTGRALSAADVIFSFERLIGSKKSRFASDFMNIRGAKEFRDGRAATISGIKPEGNLKIMFELVGRDPLFLTLLSSPVASIVPKPEILKTPHFFKQPIGTGAFEFDCSNSKFLLLRANENYFLGRPKLNRLVYKVYVDLPSEEIIADFASGQLDDIAPLTLPKNINKDNFSRVFSTGVFSFALTLNPDIPPLNKLPVRQALAHLLDVDKVLDGLERDYPYLQISHSFIPRGRTGFQPDFKRLTFDRTVALGLIKNAGYKSFNNLESIGIYFTVSLPYVTQITHYLDRTLTEVGWKHEIHVLKGKEGPQMMDSRKWNMFFAGYDTAYPDSYFLLKGFHSKWGTSMLTARSKILDNLLKQIDGEHDWRLRRKLYEQMNRKVVDLAYVIPFYSGDTFDGYFQPWIGGVAYSPMGPHHIRFHSVFVISEKTSQRKELSYSCNQKLEEKNP